MSNDAEYTIIDGLNNYVKSASLIFFMVEMIKNK